MCSFKKYVLILL